MLSRYPVFFGWKKVGIAPWVETTRALPSFSNVTGDCIFPHKSVTLLEAPERSGEAARRVRVCNVSNQYKESNHEEKT